MDSCSEMGSSLLSSARRRKPDFIGIGAQKSGTSWLWSRLEQIPETVLPPRKELNYFDRSQYYPSKSFLADAHPLRRLFRSDNARHRRRAWQDIYGAARMRDGAAFQWYIRYYLGFCDDDWYLSLFDLPGTEARLTGEISPSYSLLKTEDVRHVHTLAPDAKILFLMRNPIERAWSQVRFDWREGYFDKIYDVEAVRDHIDSPVQEERSDYLAILDRWTSVFEPDQVHVAFFDDLCYAPEHLLEGVADFLGIDPKPMKESMQERVNESPKKEMPPAIRDHLIEKYATELRKLKDRIGGRATSWYNKL